MTFYMKSSCESRSIPVKWPDQPTKSITKKEQQINE
jgi:hypothetical protein